MFLLKCSVRVETSIFKKYLMGGVGSRGHTQFPVSLVKSLSCGRVTQKNLHSASTLFVQICSERWLIHLSGTQKLWSQDSCLDSRIELSLSLPTPSLLRLNAALEHETTCRHYISSIFVLKENNRELVLSKH